MDKFARFAARGALGAAAGIGVLYLFLRCGRA